MDAKQRDSAVPIIRQLVMAGVKRALQDPRVRAKAADVAQKEVKPRVEAAARIGREQLASARQDWRQASQEVDPREKPAEFAGRLVGRVKRRLID